MRLALRPLKFAFARRIRGVPRSRSAISTIAVTSRYGTVEAALARPAFTLAGI
jgi:hypothetical protein